MTPPSRLTGVPASVSDLVQRLALAYHSSWGHPELKVTVTDRFAGGEGAAEESPAYLWNSAEGPHPKGRTLGGAHVLPSPLVEADQVACKRRE